MYLIRSWTAGASLCTSWLTARSLPRSQQEIDADAPEEPEPKSSDSQRIDALEQELAEMEASYTEGVNEA